MVHAPLPAEQLLKKLRKKEPRARTQSIGAPLNRELELDCAEPTERSKCSSVRFEVTGDRIRDAKTT